MRARVFCSALLLLFLTGTAAQAQTQEHCYESESETCAGSVENFPSSAPKRTALEQEHALSDSGETPVFKYVGNKFSSKFHRPSCPFAKAMSQYHLVFFRERHDAVDQGFKPCKYCLPAQWKTVHLLILPSQKSADRAAASVEPEANVQGKCQNR
jgi:hypothetical protein